MPKSPIETFIRLFWWIWSFLFEFWAVYLSFKRGQQLSSNHSAVIIIAPATAYIKWPGQWPLQKKTMGEQEGRRQSPTMFDVRVQQSLCKISTTLSRVLLDLELIQWLFMMWKLKTVHCIWELRLLTGMLSHFGLPGHRLNRDQGLNIKTHPWSWDNKPF